MPMVERAFQSPEELVVFANGKYPIGAVNTTAESITIRNRDLTIFLSPTDTFDISGSTGNNGTWTVSTISCDGQDTTIVVTGDLTDDTPDGIVELGALIQTDVVDIVRRDNLYVLYYWVT